MSKPYSDDEIVEIKKVKVELDRIYGKLNDPDLANFPDYMDRIFDTIDDRVATIAADRKRIEKVLEEGGISVEPLADYAHEAWSGWMKYLFKLSTLNDDGSVSIPKELVDRWTFQVNTKYGDLPENMKPTDRKEANRMLIIIRQALEGGKQ